MGQVLLPKHFAPDFSNPRVAPREDHVEINWNHPDAEDGLLFYSIGLRDLVSGEIAKPISAWGSSNSGRNHGPQGFALESHSTTLGGFVWENCTELARLHNTKFCTVGFMIAIDSLATAGNFLAVPDVATTWVDPYAKFTARLTGTLGAQFLFRRIGGADRAINSASNYLISNGKPNLYTITKNDTTTVRFYRDGVLFDAPTNVAMDDFMSNTDQFNIYAMSSNSDGDVGGMNGRSGLSVVWGRDRDAGAHARFNANPYGLLKPRVAKLYYFSAGGDTNVSATTDALTLAENAATITLDVNVAANTDALVIAEFAATIDLGVNVFANTDALVLAGQQATVSLDVDISASVNALTLTTHQATISTDLNVNIDAGFDALVLAEFAAAIANDVTVNAATDALTIAEFAASVALDVGITANTDALTLAEFAASITLDVGVAANTDALVLTEFSASIASATDVIISATTDVLVLTEFAAFVDLIKADYARTGIWDGTFTRTGEWQPANQRTGMWGGPFKRMGAWK